MKKTMTIILLFGLIVFISSNDSIAGQLYKWVDENGVKHFSDSPTDRDALGKGNFKSMPAFKRVEPVSQKDEVTKINATESISKDHAVNQQNEHRRRADRDEGRMQNQHGKQRARAR